MAKRDKTKRTPGAVARSPAPVVKPVVKTAGERAVKPASAHEEARAIAAQIRKRIHLPDMRVAPAPRPSPSPKATKPPSVRPASESASPTPSVKRAAVSKATTTPRAEHTPVKAVRVERTSESAPPAHVTMGGAEVYAEGGEGSDSLALERGDSVAATSAPGASANSQPAVGAQIRDLEAEIDSMMHKAQRREVRTEARPEALAAAGDAIRAHRDAAPAREAEDPSTRAPDDEVFDVAREMLTSSYYRKKWGRVAMRDRAEDVDEFGYDRDYERRIRPLFEFLYDRWFRVETHDIDNVPASGPVILCANHAGAIPYDGAMLATAMRREHAAHREIRWLADDFVFHFPFLGVFVNRIGAVRACQENADRMLSNGECVAVFPEGVKGIAKLFRDRYKLQRFGRGGHVKLALRTRATIVPVAIVGAEETHPMLAPTTALAKFLGVPYFPFTPTFPLLGPLGLVPLPAKWKIHFLEPVTMDAYPPESADDDVLVGRLNEKIRTQIQDRLDRAIRERTSVFRG